MRKFSFALAALAALCFAMPSIVRAEDKPMKEGMMHHHHHHHHHHKMMMKKKEM